MGDNIASFTAEHHALLFGWVSEAVVKLAGEDTAEEVMRKAVRIYGQERGRRMAMRAESNGHELTMANYLAYAEYQVDRNQISMQILEKVPNARINVHRCPWINAWEKHGMLLYSRYYCLEIDKAVLAGFNPELKLDLGGTQSSESNSCEFVFHGANLTTINFLKSIYRKKINPGKNARMPWIYHCGHLYTSLVRVIVDEFGDAGQEAVNTAMVKFGNYYDAEAAEIIKAYRIVDFSVLPD